MRLRPTCSNKYLTFRFSSNNNNIGRYPTSSIKIAPSEQSSEDQTRLEHTRRVVEQSKLSQENALFATGAGAGANLFLFLSKGIAGYSVGSTALIADCLGSLGDLCTDAIVYYSVKEAREAATADSPWGRGKMEPIGKYYYGPLFYLLRLFTNLDFVGIVGGVVAVRCIFGKWCAGLDWGWHRIQRIGCGVGNDASIHSWFVGMVACDVGWWCGGYNGSSTRPERGRCTRQPRSCVCCVGRIGHVHVH